MNVNKKINSKIAVISGVSIIFAYLEIQYMVVPFEGLGVGILWAMLVIYACLFMDGNIFQKMYASMFIIATIIFVTVLLGSIMGALYNVHFIEFTGTASMEKCLLVILIQITIWIVAVILVRILRRYSYGVNIKDTVIIMAAMIMSVIITNEVQMMSTDSDAEKMIVRSIIIMICVTIMFILCVALYEIIQRSTYALMEQTIMEQAYKSRLENVEDIETNVEALASLIYGVYLSYKAEGYAGLKVGSLGLLSLLFSIIGSVIGLLSFKEDDKFYTLSKVGSLLCGILAVFMAARTC